MVPLGIATSALGQSLSFHHHQQLQIAIATGLPRAPQHNTMDNNTFERYNSSGLTNLSAPGTLPVYNAQTATNTPSMVTDIATMAKVIPNVPLKLQQKITQVEFIDLSELLQANFQLIYALVVANVAFELVHKDETVLMQPRKKGKQIDSLGNWLSTWALHEQVMVYVYPQKYSELAYYRTFVMHQDKKFNWSAVQMYDIRFQAMCTHHGCTFTTTDQALVATIVDAIAVKTLAYKCFRCGSFNHLVDGCPFPQAASLEMAEMTKKGIQVRQAAKSGPFKSTSPIQTKRWFHNGREGCNNYHQDRCTFPHCKGAHICHSCKQEHPAS